MILVVQKFDRRQHGDGASAYGDCAKTTPYPACSSAADCTIRDLEPYQARAKLHVKEKVVVEVVVVVVVAEVVVAVDVIVVEIEVAVVAEVVAVVKQRGKYYRR